MIPVCVTGCDVTRSRVVRMPMVMVMIMALPGCRCVVPLLGVCVVFVPAQEPGADDVYDQSQHRDRDRFREADGNRRKESRNRLVTDE